MRKVLTAAAAVAVLTVPLLAGAQGGNEAPGWEHRLDFGGDVNDLLHFRPMGDGVHATTTGAGWAIFWQPESTASGHFSISATFTQMERSGHANAYGIFFGGADLAGDGQRYTYFMLRQGGEFLVRQRMGEDLPILVDWTADDAINDLDANGASTNTLTVEARDDTVRFLVNGTEVSSQPRSDVDADGVTGLRVTHMLNVHVSDLDLGN